MFNYESRRDGLPVRFVPSSQRYRGPLLLCYVRRPLWRLGGERVDSNFAVNVRIDA